MTDITIWYKNLEGKPSSYYHKMIALFICYGILFENFLLEGDEGKFTNNIVRSSIQKVKEHFELKPLIVRLRPKESEEEPFWCWYPGRLEEEVQRLMDGNISVMDINLEGQQKLLYGAVGCGK